MSVTDQSGRPVSDLSARRGRRHGKRRRPPRSAACGRSGCPVALTIAVDNGPLSVDALRALPRRIDGLVRALPEDMEVTLITTSPQPMMVVHPTDDRLRLLRGVNGFAPQEDSPRFTDTIVEFSRRYEDALKETNRIASLRSCSWCRRPSPRP
jgi:hypothetical protein